MEAGYIAMIMAIIHLVLCPWRLHRWDYRSFRCCSEHTSVERICTTCGHEQVYVRGRWESRERRYWQINNQ